MFKILYICTHNRCRSILSEAITNHLANGQIVAKSAGSEPSGQVHPLSIQYLQQAGIHTDELQSQSWDKFETFDPDLVITVCDSAAGESCPLWLTKSVKIHWGLTDPSKLQGSDSEIAAAFNACIGEIQKRVHTLLQLPLSALSPKALQQTLHQLGAE